MISKSRLLARKYQIESGNRIYFGLLSLFISVALISALPFLYRSFILPNISESLRRYSEIMSLVLSSLIVIFMLVFLKCINLGFKRFFLRKAENLNASFADIFFYLNIKEFFCAFLYFIKLLLYKAFFFFICFSPLGLIVFMFHNIIAGISFAVGCIIFLSTLLIFLNSLFFYKRITASLFLSDYYYISGKFITFSHLIASSQNSMKNKTNELLKMKLSFFGWFMLCVLIVPSFYVFGYYRQSLAVLAADYIKE